MRHLVWVLSLLSIIFTPSVKAKEFEPRTIKDFFWEPLKNIPGDLNAAFVDENNRPNLITLSIAATTTVGALTAHELNDQPFGTFNDGASLHLLSGWVSNSGMIYSLTVPLGFYLVKDYDTGDQLIESLLLTMGTIFPFKAFISRTGPSPRNEQSFPSGHTAIAFATATSLAYTCPWYVGIPSLLIAGAIGTARLDLHFHYLSDVIAGAGIGAFYASAVWLHHHEKNKNSAIVLAPWFSPSSIGLTLTGF